MNASIKLQSFWMKTLKYFTTMLVAPLLVCSLIIEVRHALLIPYRLHNVIHVKYSCDPLLRDDCYCCPPVHYSFLQKCWIFASLDLDWVHAAYCFYAIVQLQIDSLSLWPFQTLLGIASYSVQQFNILRFNEQRLLQHQLPVLWAFSCKIDIVTYKYCIPCCFCYACQCCFLPLDRSLQD